jgi:hypothetical protein
MNPFARIVHGYHGCTADFATEIISGMRSVKNWSPSENEYDWLGRGIYFWEHGPARAQRWAATKVARTDAEPAVVGAVIQLGRCLDLTDASNTVLLAESYRLLKESFDSVNKQLPRNGGRDLKARNLDCLVINYLLQQLSGERSYQTVRCAFTEGEPIYDGAMLFEETHVQVAVVDPSCILGVFRPTFDYVGETEQVGKR